MSTPPIIRPFPAKPAHVCQWSRDCRNRIAFRVTWTIPREVGTDVPGAIGSPYTEHIDVCRDCNTAALEFGLTLNHSSLSSTRIP